MGAPQSEDISNALSKTHIPSLADFHYSDIMMDAMLSQIVYSGADQNKYESSASLAICAGNSPVTGEFPAQMASNAENVSIWWRHHVF